MFNPMCVNSFNFEVSFIPNNEFIFNIVCNANLYCATSKSKLLSLFGVNLSKAKSVLKDKFLGEVNLNSINLGARVYLNKYVTFKTNFAFDRFTPNNDTRK